MKTYSKVYISILYYKFYSAEFDSKYRFIQKPLLSNEKQTNLYLFYYLESLVEVEWALLSPPPPLHTSSLFVLRARSIEALEMSTCTTSWKGRYHLFLSYLKLK